MRIVEPLVCAALLLVLVLSVHGHRPTNYRPKWPYPRAQRPFASKANNELPNGSKPDAQRPLGSISWEHKFRRLFSQISTCESQFVCQTTEAHTEQCNLTCIQKNKLCDHRQDCLYGDDEIGCDDLDNSCDVSEFTCLVDGKKTCLPYKKVCDGLKNCDNNEDETACPCNESEFTCLVDGKKTCLPYKNVCDGFKNCDNNEDETACPCKESEFTCLVDGVKKCLPSQQLCDGVQHCDNNEDEGHCSCNESEFTCLVDGVKTCLPYSKLCDGIKQCDDNRDETACHIKPFYFTWTLVASTSEKGVVTHGSKSDLIDAVMTGADVRIQLKHNGYLTSVENAVTVGDNLCAQSLFHISKEGYDSHKADAYWEFLHVCTSGDTYIALYYVGTSSQPESDTIVNYAVNWFVRSPTNLPLQYTLTRYATIGGVSGLVNDVMAGSDIRAVAQSYGRTYKMDSVEVSSDRSVVVSQSINQLSMSYEPPENVGDATRFFDYQYYIYFNFVSDTEHQKRERFIGNTYAFGSTEEPPSLTYYTDTNWQLAYSHDDNGIALEGSLETLRMAVLMGHRVKVQYAQVTVEPDEIQVIGDDINAVVLSMIAKDPAKFRKFRSGWSAWDWRILTTTGAERTVLVKLGEYEEFGRTTGSRTVTWFTDTRPWTSVLVNTDNGSVVSGSKAKLIDAINKGARVRYTQRFDDGNQVTIIHEADNLAIEDGEVAAQHVRSVGVKDAGNNELEFNDENDLYWLFTISSTTGNVDRSKWLVGEDENKGRDSAGAYIEWFVDVDVDE